MVTSLFSRRDIVLLALASTAIAKAAVAADDYIDLKWEELIPEGAKPPSGSFRQMISDLMGNQPPSTGVREDWNGMNVRLPGFVVPIEFDGDGVVGMILVPFVGACVHVPPPPANQLVYVTTEKPFASKGLFEQVTVEGQFGTSPRTHRSIEIGYVIEADRIQPFT